MNYLIITDNTITNIIVCDTDEIAEQFGAVPIYDGARIGDAYDPPPPPEPAPTLDDRVSDLEANKADKTEVAAVWDQMAAAYQEGVQSA